MRIWIQRPRSVAAAAAVLCFAGAATAQQPCGVPGPDAVIGSIHDIINHTAVAGYDAITLGAALCNNGTISITCANCPTSNNHPLMAANLYRYRETAGGAGGRMEQVGMSWVKNNYGPINSSTICSCQSGGTGIRPGCTDVYSAGFQAGSNTLGPRYVVNAFTAAVPVACPTHPSGGNFGRLEVAIADLTTTPGGGGATTRYFGEQHMLSPGDATYTDAANPMPLNGLNNASSIELAVTGGPSEFAAALLGGNVTTQVGVAAIQRWKQIDPAVTESAVIVPAPPSAPNAIEGMFIVCSKATALGGTPPMWHYEYAVYNRNSDRCGGWFSVPVADGVTVSNVDFHGVTYRGGDGNAGVNVDSAAWTATRSAGALTWATTPFAGNPNGNAIRWGTTYNFRFEADVPPAPGGASAAVSVGLWKPPAVPDGPVSITAAAQVPSVPPDCGPVDHDANGQVQPADVAAFVGTWYASVQGGTLAGDFDGSGSVTSSDVAAFVSAWFEALSEGC